MTETFTELPQLPARRFPISRKSAEYNRRIFARMAPIVLLLCVCAMGIPIAMHPLSHAVSLYLALFIPCFFMTQLSLLIGILTKYGCISYSVDSGFLTVNLGGRRSWYRNDLSKITKAVIGNIEHPEEMRMQLLTHRGRVLGIPATEDMEEFVAAVASYVPIEIERRCEALPIWTKQTLAVIALSLIFLVSLFTSLGYMIV